MVNFFKSNKIHFKIHLGYVICIILLMIALIGGYFISSSSQVSAKELEIEKKKEKKEDKIEKIKVDVKGAVNNPGVYELELGSRVIDAINASGGLMEGANTSIINLSKKLEDEFVIVIYTDNDLRDVVMDKYVINNNNCPSTINDACIVNSENSNKQTDTNTKSNSIQKTTQRKINEDNTNSIVNINTATLEELMTISGIGESKAKAIISYREENNGFKSIDELTNVSGIGVSTFEKIKDSITV